MPSRIERWACAKLMRFKQTKCKVLYMGHSNPEHKYRLTGEWVETSPEEKVLGVLVDKKLNRSQQCALTPRKPTVSWVASKEAWRGPLYFSLVRPKSETPPGVLYPALEFSAQEGHGPARTGPEEGNEDG
ncbi:rna-directed dna polymerase from mobile element jockey- hypothetical protein [Limosa lapponica baueri]|uniref:Rna-directed dna polymerase from mobile element jockey-like n=1 Tax=Limosa lapponica baueri TaxID=1758121 RepID=A0A2I0UCQ1_LIMLA|nr:rna-directed dna polymerase from mobile element jockey- hypothetical protein [Limosa lapponica baueri]